MSESLYDAALDEEPVKVEEVKEEIDERLQSLIYRGDLKDSVKVGPHEVRIKTLKVGEELEAALVADPWKDTAEAWRAMATASVAASIISVDGNPLVEGLGPKDETVEAKFDYIRKNWYWVSVKVVFDQYNELLLQSLEQHGLLKKD